MTISMDDFSKVEMKIGRIVSVEDIPQARRPMYKLMTDFGDGNPKQRVGGIKEFYTKGKLVGRLVVAVVNLQPEPVAGVISECMMLAAFDDTHISLLSPDTDLPLGTKVG